MGLFDLNLWTRPFKPYRAANFGLLVVLLALLAVSAGGNAVSANIELIGTHDIRVTAVLNIAGSSLGFVATGSPSADRTSGANVVGILRNRQA